MKKNIITKEKLDVLTPNVVDNDLLFITSVLSKIDDVVSHTYGPSGGYVGMIDGMNKPAEEQHKYQRKGYTYTKDGMETIKNLKFNRPAEHDVVSLVTLLAHEIKMTSGDGSTTAAKLLYQIVKAGTEFLHNKEITDKKKRTTRINTPKAIEKLIKLIEKYSDKENNFLIHSGSYQDLIDGAFISLNNDTELIKPIEELVDYLKENEAEIDETFKIDAFISETDKTYVDKKPGYLLNTSRFLLDRYADRKDEAKIVMLNLNLTSNMLRFIILPLLEFVQTQNVCDNVVFLINNVDDDARLMLDNIYKDVSTGEDGNKRHIKFDFIVSRNVYSESFNFKKDISYLADTEVITLDQLVEMRREYEYPMVDNTIDNFDTTELIKWTAKISKNAKGDTVSIDYDYGKRIFFEKISNALNKGKRINIARLDGAGLTLSLANGEEKSQALVTYMNDLKEALKSHTKEVRDDATQRLYFLNDNLYVINVARRKYDGMRLEHAYRDATKAITSIAKYGYHPGGSVGLYYMTVFIKTELENELEELKIFKEKFINKRKQVKRSEWTYEDYKNMSYYENEETMLETALEIVSFLENSVINLIQELVLGLSKSENTGFRMINEDEFYEGTYDNDDTFKIVPHLQLFGNTRVISPVETDLILSKTILYQFSNLFSSLSIEYGDAMDVAYFLSISNEIKDKMEGRKSANDLSNDETTIEEEPKPVVKKEFKIPSFSKKFNEEEEEVIETNDEEVVDLPSIQSDEISNETSREVLPVEGVTDDRQDLSEEEELRKRLEFEAEKRLAKLKEEQKDKALSEAMMYLNGPDMKNAVIMPDEYGRMPEFFGKVPKALSEVEDEDENIEPEFVVENLGL